MLILAFPDYLPQAQRLADRLNLSLESVCLHYFPDGESLLRLPSELPDHVIVCRSLNQPNEKLVELMLCAESARKAGVKRISLVAPYMCYMRQDIANQPGEAVSQRIIGRFLAGLFDDVITVDPHLHRISRLQQAIPLPKAIALTAADVIADFLQQQFDHAVLLGPDSESEQWVAAIADRIGFSYAVADKVRRGDKSVEIRLPSFDFHQQSVVIIDDMASSGRTLAKASTLVKQAGARLVCAAITHPLFCGDAEQHIREAGVEQVWSTDSISHSTACIHLDRLLANAIREQI